MKKCNVCGEDKSDDLFFKRYAKCKECMKVEKREAYQKNKDKQKAQAIDRYNKNKANICEYRKAKRLEDPEKSRAYSRAMYAKHQEKALANKKKYHEENAGLVGFKHSVRKFKDACPIWITEEMREEMIAIYEKASEMKRKTGIDYTVDHIVPRLGRKVKGLHVPWNLQILTRSENSTKGNR